MCEQQRCGGGHRSEAPYAPYAFGAPATIDAGGNGLLSLEEAYMSAVEALRLARRNGIRLGVAGADLILDADQEPAPRVLEAIRRHKAGIVALLTAAEDDWTAEEWRVFHDERAGIAEHDGGQARAKAEALAFECCIVEWLNRHPQHSDPGHCAWCGKPDPDGHAVVPFGTESHGHTWLHPECWNDWSRDRRQKAQEALAPMGLIARIPL